MEQVGQSPILQAMERIERDPVFAQDKVMSPPSRRRGLPQITWEWVSKSKQADERRYLLHQEYARLAGARRMELDG